MTITKTVMRTRKTKRFYVKANPAKPIPTFKQVAPVSGKLYLTVNPEDGYAYLWKFVDGIYHMVNRGHTRYYRD